MGKSETVPIREENNLDALANILSCKVGNLPMKYLGMPLGTSFKTASIWNPTLEKMEKKLSAWKCLYLSKGGRLTLLKSTLSSFLTYFFGQLQCRHVTYTSGHSAVIYQNTVSI